LNAVFVADRFDFTAGGIAKYKPRSALPNDCAHPSRQAAVGPWRQYFERSHRRGDLLGDRMTGSARDRRRRASADRHHQCGWQVSGGEFNGSDGKVRPLAEGRNIEELTVNRTSRRPSRL